MRRALEARRRALAHRLTSAEAAGGLTNDGRGEVLAEATGDDHGRAVECVLSVEVDLDATTAYRTAFPVLDDRRL